MDAGPDADVRAVLPGFANSLQSRWSRERPQVVQKALNAIYGGVSFLAADANRAAAVKLIAEIDEIPESIAARELDGNIKNLSATGEMPKKVRFHDFILTYSGASL